MHATLYLHGDERVGNDAAPRERPAYNVRAELVARARRKLLAAQHPRDPALRRPLQREAASSSSGAADSCRRDLERVNAGSIPEKKNAM